MWVRKNTQINCKYKWSSAPHNILLNVCNVLQKYSIRDKKLRKMTFQGTARQLNSQTLCQRQYNCQYQASFDNSSQWTSFSSKIYLCTLWTSLVQSEVYVTLYRIELLSHVIVQTHNKIYRSSNGKWRNSRKARTNNSFCVDHDIGQRLHLKYNAKATEKRCNNCNDRSFLFNQN